MVKIIYINIFLVILSCTSKYQFKENIIQEITDSSRTATILVIEKNQTYYIKWALGNNIYCNKLDYPYVHDYLGMDQNYIYLRYSCGTACWGIRLLPKTKDINSKEFLYPIFHSKNFKYIITGNSDVENQLFVIETHQKIKSILNFKKIDCSETFYIDCINAQIENNKIYIKYPDGVKVEININDLKWNSW